MSGSPRLTLAVVIGRVTSTAGESSLNERYSRNPFRISRSAMRTSHSAGFRAEVARACLTYGGLEKSCPAFLLEFTNKQFELE